MGILPTSNLEKHGDGGRPARVPSLAFFSSKTSLLVTETARSQLEENCIGTW